MIRTVKVCEKLVAIQRVNPCIVKKIFLYSVADNIIMPLCVVLYSKSHDCCYYYYYYYAVATVACHYYQMTLSWFHHSKCGVIL